MLGCRPFKLKRLKADKLYDLLEDLYEVVVKIDDSLINKQMKEAKEFNMQFSSSTMPLSLYNGIDSCIAHPQAVYTSRLLDFKNLPEPKNADDDFLEDYSGN